MWNIFQSIFIVFFEGVAVVAPAVVVVVGLGVMKIPKWKINQTDLVEHSQTLSLSLSLLLWSRDGKEKVDEDGLNRNMKMVDVGKDEKKEDKDANKESKKEQKERNIAMMKWRKREKREE